MLDKFVSFLLSPPETSVLGNEDEEDGGGIIESKRKRSDVMNIIRT